jgi:hypothetical protein
MPLLDEHLVSVFKCLTRLWPFDSTEYAAKPAASVYSNWRQPFALLFPLSADDVASLQGRGVAILCSGAARCI